MGTNSPARGDGGHTVRKAGGAASGYLRRFTEILLRPATFPYECSDVWLMVIHVRLYRPIDPQPINKDVVLVSRSWRNTILNPCVRARRIAIEYNGSIDRYYYYFIFIRTRGTQTEQIIQK